MMQGSVIPDKLYFKIGEVSNIIGVKPYVLRYWETEFKELAPVKSRTNQRLYKRKDVELLVQIKSLLHDERFTINGARKRLKSNSRGGHKESLSNQLPLDLSVQGEVSPLTSQDITSQLKELIKEIQESVKN